MQKRDALMKPAEFTEHQLIEAILSGEFSVGSNLPAERELARQLGVTRPTLREVLQRLARDGWLDIQQGKATRIKDYLREGNLGVLSAIVRHPARISENFIANLLEFRTLVAPQYTFAAITRHPARLEERLAAASALGEDPLVFAHFDWLMHHQLAVLSENPVYPLLLNSFTELYMIMGMRFYRMQGSYEISRQFYQGLKAAVQQRDASLGRESCRQAMKASELKWREIAAVLLSGEASEE